MVCYEVEIRTIFKALCLLKEWVSSLAIQESTTNDSGS